MGRQFKIKVDYIAFVLLFFFFACQPSKKNTAIDLKNGTTHFEIEHFEDYTVITVNNPFSGSDFREKYVLYPEGTLAPKIDGVTHFISTPIKKAAITSTTHLGYLEAIDQTNTIIAANNLDFFYSETFQNRVRNGNVHSIGEREINSEQLIEEQVDVTFAFAIDISDYSQIQRWRELGQKVVLIAEFMEQDPISKASWLKVFAALTGEEKKAEKKLDNIEKRYDSIRQMASEKTRLPRVLMGFPWKGTWFVGGGKSFQARLFEDAGGNYLWSENSKESGVPLDIEVVLEKAIDADVWINTNAIRSLQNLKEADPRFSSFSPVKKRMIFNNDKRLNVSGGNDYWESGVVRPDRILEDLYMIFQKDSVQADDLYYYRRLPNE